MKYALLVVVMLILAMGCIGGVTTGTDDTTTLTPVITPKTPKDTVEVDVSDVGNIDVDMPEVYDEFNDTTELGSGFEDVELF